MSDLPQRPWYRISELAAHLDTEEFTIRRWIDHGKLEAHKMPGGIRISRESWEVFIKKSVIDPFK